MMRILAIDDNQDNLTALRAVVSDRLPEAEVLTAASGPAGLDLARNADPDVVLLDIVMPAMDGYEVCRQLKKDPVLQAIPVLFLTANRTDRASRIKALEAGAEGFLAKPFDEIELIAQIRSMAKIKAAASTQRTENERLETLVAERTRELVRELDDRKRAEAEVRESERRFRDVFELSPLGKSITGIDGSLHVNQAFSDIVGYSEAELREKRWQEITHPEDVQASEDVTQSLIAGKIQRARFEKRYLHKSGRVVWAEVTAVLQRDGEHGTLQFLTAINDITERRRAEAALAKREREYCALAENSQDYIMRYDRQHRHVYANRAAIGVTGLSAEEYVGKTHREMGFPEQLCVLWEQAIDRTFATGATQREVFEWQGEEGDVVLDWRAFPEFGAKDTVETVLAVSRDITELKRVEEKLRASEQSYRNQFAMNSAAMLLIDPVEGTILDANATALDFYGYPREQLLAMHITDINALPAPEVQQAMDSVQPEHGEGFEFQHRLADGSTRHVGVSSSRIRIGERTVLHSIITDITERKKVEEALRERDALLNEVGQIARIGGWQMDLVTRKANWTRTTYDIVGIDPGEPIPGPDEHLDYYLPQYRPLVAEAMRALVEENRPLDFEAQARTAKGSIRWFHTIGKAVRQEGKCVRVHGTLQDITERKQAAEKLRASDELLKRLSAQIPGMIYQYQYFSGGRSCFPFASEGVWDIYEVTPQDIREDGTEVFGRMHLADRDRVIQSILDSRDHLTQWACDFRVDLPTKGVRWIRGASNPQKQEDGSVIWHGYATDITEQKQMEAASEKLQEQLQQARKMDAVGQLAGGIAHDFNNMLEVIIGHTEFALDDVNPTQPLHADLQEVLKAAQRSADLTRQLLTFARKQAISPEILDLNDTVDGVLSMLRRLIGENIDLDWHAREGLWPVMMDPSQIDQILANLCVNARDAIADVGAITIRLENAVLDETCSSGLIRPAPGEYVVLSVSDNGCGMDEETIAHVFEPFFTTKEMGKGTGLGLATVYGIVQQNGGGLDICSEPDQGTAFAIYLPRHVGAVPAVSDKQEAPAQRGTETVLVVEDEVAILKMAKKMLESRGYTVLAAASPGEATSLFAAHTYEIDLLVADVIMPEMNGQDLATQLASLSPRLKCLFMSGYTADVIAHHGVLDEGVHFIQKPFSIGGLAGKVREVLDENQGAQ